MRYALRDLLLYTAILFLLRLSAAFFFADRSPDSLSGLEALLLWPDRLEYLQTRGWPDFAWTTLLWSFFIAFLTVLLLHSTGLLTSRTRSPDPPERP